MCQSFDIITADSVKWACVYINIVRVSQKYSRTLSQEFGVCIYELDVPNVNRETVWIPPSVFQKMKKTQIKWST